MSPDWKIFILTPLAGIIHTGKRVYKALVQSTNQFGLGNSLSSVVEFAQCALLRQVNSCAFSFTAVVGGWEMMKSIVLICLSLTLGLVVWAADGQNAPSPQAAKDVPDTRVTVVRGKPNPGKVTIAAGETFRIELPGEVNALPDFEWAVTKVDPAMVAVGPQTRMMATDARNTRETFVFPVQGLKPGKTKMRLEYRQSVEKVASTRTFTLNITVTPKK
jgi:hypothetical protein